jgi:FAD/FMN-containing dehydrogenase
MLPRMKARLVMLAAALAAPAFADESPAYFCKPGQPCWPTADEWNQLGTGLAGKLLVPEAPPPGAHTPFQLEDHAGATQSVGWLGAWSTAPSAYAVEAGSAKDIARAVDFARAHHLRIVVKGTGHDYLGRSAAKDTLLVWTHDLRKIQVDDHFIPAGCKVAATPAVRVEAGARWLEVYQEVTTRHGRYVQGGGCTSVGAAGGFLQGGGFGSWSKKFGIAAGSLLEAEVVTADGNTQIANACTNPDLFWALRGGGGGTFGVVTRVTLRTYDLPKTFGGVLGKITAKNEKDYRALVEQLVRFYGQSLSNEHWGEQVTLHGDNTLDLALLFEGLTRDEAEQVWKPFTDWLASQGTRYGSQVITATLPAAQMWNHDILVSLHLPVVGDADHWWWKSNEDEVGAFWAAYQSRWIPSTEFDDAHAAKLAQALVAASRQWSVSLHFNKGQAGAAADALDRDRETAVNPQVLDAAALVIVAAYADPKNSAKSRSARDGVAAAMKPIIALTPGAGSYVNETDYFETDWKHAFWGKNYERLLAIKHAVDPDGLFFCHHCVGSDEALARTK